MIRLFSAIRIPPAISVQLSALRGGLDDARWIDMDDYHITLRFFGNVDFDTAAEIDAQLAAIACGSLSVTIQGLDQFGGAKPRSVFARVVPNEALNLLYLQNERCARRMGLESEARKFTPHVTIARLKSASSTAVAAYLSLRGYFPPLIFEVNSFALFSSRGTAGGGPYRLENEYDLAR